MSDTRIELPDGFRIVHGEVVMGTGMGDELYGPILQRWETRTVRRGILRRRASVTRWWTVEKGSGFTDNSTDLIKTAWEMSKG